MQQTDNEITLEYNRTLIKAEKLADQVAFRIHFPNEIPDITIAKAADSKGTRCWTSIPEGMPEMAEEIGTLIEDYYRQKS